MKLCEGCGEAVPTNKAWKCQEGWLESGEGFIRTDQPAVYVCGSCFDKIKTKEEASG